MKNNSKKLIICVMVMRINDSLISAETTLILWMTICAPVRKIARKMNLAKNDATK